MPYNVPGNVDADVLTPELINIWNEMIQRVYKIRRVSLGSRFSAPNADDFPSDGPLTIQWSAHPKEPEVCLNAEKAKKLCDWGSQGHQLHNEYCEYRIITDENGQKKRIQVTTELREYWVMLAKYAPEILQQKVQEVLRLKESPKWPELYGPGVENPAALSPEQREIKFAVWMAGHGGDPNLIYRGVPPKPVGPLNTKNLLFMTNPGNGLDNLFYLLMFGAHAYTYQQNPIIGAEQIFKRFNREQWSCRHTDPAAAYPTATAAFNGQAVAFKDPLGVYIKLFNRNKFYLGTKKVNEVRSHWIRESRGEENMWQRLEFGPDDDEPETLEDITIGENGPPLEGGYQLLEQITVGPRVRQRGQLEEMRPQPDEFVEVEPFEEFTCGDSEKLCKLIVELYDQYQAENPLPLP